MSGKHSAGKGDKSRFSDFKQYQENYDKCFGKKKLIVKHESEEKWKFES